MQKNLRIEHLKTNIPELFTHPGKLLYIGASRTRSQCVPELRAASNEITLIEAFPPNAAFHQKNPIFTSVICFDICLALNKGLPSKFYDYIFWWHGPEHVTKTSFLALEKYFRKHTSMIILACPFGRYPQGAAYNNPFEKHLTTFYPQDFVSLQYTFSTIGLKDTPGSHILAWKKTNLYNKRRDPCPA